MFCFSEIVLFQFYFSFISDVTTVQNNPETFQNCFHVLVLFYFTYVTTSEIKLKQYCFISVLFQM